MLFLHDRIFIKGQPNTLASDLQFPQATLQSIALSWVAFVKVIGVMVCISAILCLDGLAVCSPVEEDPAIRVPLCQVGHHDNGKNNTYQQKKMMRFQ